MGHLTYDRLDEAITFFRDLSHFLILGIRQFGPGLFLRVPAGAKPSVNLRNPPCITTELVSTDSSRLSGVHQLAVAEFLGLLLIDSGIISNKFGTCNATPHNHCHLQHLVVTLAQ